MLVTQMLEQEEDSYLRSDVYSVVVVCCFGVGCWSSHPCREHRRSSLSRVSRLNVLPRTACLSFSSFFRTRRGKINRTMRKFRDKESMQKMFSTTASNKTTTVVATTLIHRRRAPPRLAFVLSLTGGIESTGCCWRCSAQATGRRLRC